MDNNKRVKSNILKKNFIKVKKTLIYIFLFVLGSFVGYIFNHINSNDFNLKNQEDVIRRNNKTCSFEHVSIKATSDMLGKYIILKGSIKSVLKNKHKELVIQIMNNEISTEITCALSDADKQITTPLKLGQTINVKGLFCQYDGQILLKNCKLLDSSSVNL